MSKVIIERSNLESIASSIRNKNGTMNTYKPREMANAINEIGGIDDYFELEPTSSIYDWVKTKYIKKLPDITIPNTLTSLTRFCYGGVFSGFVPKIICTNSIISTQMMYYNCYVNYIDVTGLDTSNVTNMASMFEMDSILNNLDMSNFDMGKVVMVNGIFSGCSNLTDLQFGYDLGKAYLPTASANYNYYKLVNTYSLTHDSLMSIINGVYDIASIGVKPQQLVLGTTNLAKLNDDEKAIAINKGWTLS